MNSPAGIPLATVLQRRRALTPGEVVTLVVPLARALADLHRGGIVHGAVDADNVVIAVDGRPVLTDRSAADGSAEADDRALVALAAVAMGRDATGPVASALRSGLAGEDLAAALLAAARPAPIQLSGQQRTALAQNPVVVSDRRRTAAVGVLALAIAVVVGLMTTGHASGTRTRVGGDEAVADAQPLLAAAAAPPGDNTASVGTQAAAPTQWLSVVAALERRRAAAYARDDSSLLSSVYVAGSPALLADCRQLREQLGGDSRARGFAAQVLRVRVVSRTPRRVVLAVVDSWSAYDVVRGARVVRRGAARPARRVVLTLQQTSDGWRIESVHA